MGGELPLFKGNTLQFGAINRAIFPSISHRFHDNHAYGEIMRRFWIGLITKEDTKRINNRFIEDDNVYLSPINTIFTQYLMVTHANTSNDTNTTDDQLHCPDHMCIIKTSMRYRNKKVRAIQLQNVQPPVRRL